MPGKGSSGMGVMNFAVAGAAMSNQVPERYQDAMQYGINFFELRLPRPEINNQVLFGFFDVRVTHDMSPSSSRIVFNDEWLTDMNARIEFEIVNNRGLSVAFVPDDKYWHNRVVLADTSGLILAQYHTSQGVVPGRVMIQELRALKETINRADKIYKLVDDNNVERVFFWSKEEAEQEKLKEMTTRDPVTGVLRANFPYKGWRIVEGLKSRKRPEIVDLIKKHRSMRFGWTECAEFHEIWVPKIKARTEELLKDMEPVDGVGAGISNSGLLSSVKAMSPAERKALKAMLMGGDETAKTAAAPAQELPGIPDVDEHALPSNDTSAPAAEQGGNAEQYTKEQLHAMKKPELAKIAEGLDATLPTSQMNKSELIETIFGLQQLSIASSTLKPGEGGDAMAGVSDAAEEKTIT